MDIPKKNNTKGAAAGKPEQGTIRLSAYHESGQIVIQIADDGRGLNTARIREKAITQGLMQEGDKLSDAQIHKFIFASGFSTAAAVTCLVSRAAFSRFPRPPDRPRNLHSPRQIPSKPAFAAGQRRFRHHLVRRMQVSLEAVLDVVAVGLLI